MSSIDDLSYRDEFPAEEVAHVNEMKALYKEYACRVRDFVELHLTIISYLKK